MANEDLLGRVADYSAHFKKLDADFKAQPVYVRESKLAKDARALANESINLIHDLLKRLEGAGGELG